MERDLLRGALMPSREPADPWEIHEAAFPERGTSAQKLEFCLRYAVLAPSGHNTQPWFFAVGEETVDLYADRLRALPVVDPDDRELTLSCGAALEFLLVALGHFGARVDVGLFHDRKTPDHLARVHVRGFGPRTEDALFDAIPKRHTNRVAFGEEPVAREAVLLLEAEVGHETVWFQKVQGLEERIDLADLIEEGDRIQMADRRFRRELAQWVHANRSGSRDGMPGYAFQVGDLASRVGPLVLRTFDLGASTAARDRALALHSPLLAVLGTTREAPDAWLTAGRALARVLLRATSLGLSASFLNQPIEVAELRLRLASAVNRAGFPQVLLRLGRAPAARPTPRRSLEDVLPR
jgi:hypothetical protein